MLGTLTRPMICDPFPGQLRQVADEIREFLLYSAGISGGHFGAGLGVVELTVALHFCLDTPLINWFGTSDIRLTHIRF